MDLGKQIRKARVKSGLTQEALSHILGISKGSVSGYENNRVRPTLDVINAIADALGLQMSELLTDAADEGESGSNAEIQTSKRPRRVKRLMGAFDMLNEEGQKKAIEMVEQLCLIQIYTKSVAGTLLQYVSSRHRQMFMIEKDEETHGVYDGDDAPPGGQKWSGRHMVFCNQTDRRYTQRWDFFYHTFDDIPDTNVIKSILRDEAVSDDPENNIAFALDDKAVFQKFIYCYMERKAECATESDAQMDEAPVLFVLLDKETWTIIGKQECDPNFEME